MLIENQIDSALESMKEFSKLIKETASAIMRMRHNAIFSDGIFPEKTKTAMATFGLLAPNANLV